MRRTALILVLLAASAHAETRALDEFFKGEVVDFVGRRVIVHYDFSHPSQLDDFEVVALEGLCPEGGGTVRVEVISVGREMLRGKIPDGNAQRVARLVTQRGAMIRRITVVDDTAVSISTALRESLERDPHLVVTTGGLGPAEDDRTLEGVSAALSRPLAFDHAAKSMVEAAYRRLKGKGVVRAGGLTAAREKLCLIPVGHPAESKSPRTQYKESKVHYERW